MSEDDRRPFWVVPTALLVVVAGIVVISIVGPKLPRQSDIDLATSTTSTTAALAGALPGGQTVLPEFDPAPGWQDLGFLREPHYFGVTVDTGSELLIFGGGSDPGAADPQWSGATVDLATGAINELPTSPMCDAGMPTGVWTGTELVVWSATSIPQRCPSAAAYSPDTRQWRVIDSSFFREAGGNVVWTGEELISTKGIAYRFDSRVTRTLPAIASLPAFVGHSYAIAWTGTEIMAVSSEGVAGLDPSSGALTEGTAPPVTGDFPFSGAITGAAWTGDSLLAVGPSDALLYDPATGEWTSVPLLTGCSPAISSTRRFAFVNLCDGIAVWDGSGTWKLLPPAGFYVVPMGEPGVLVDAAGYLYQVGRRVLRYRLPQLVDGMLPQPALVPFGSVYMELMPHWEVVDSFTISKAPFTRTFGLDISAPELGSGCKIESTPSRTNGSPYIPVFTEAAKLTRDHDQIDIPVGEGWDDEGLAHVVINTGRTIVDVSCGDMAQARVVAARLWSPGAPPSTYPSGTEVDTTCYVALSIGSEPADEATEITVQVAFAARESCAVQGPLALSFWAPAVYVTGNPVAVDLGQELSAEQPYLVARYAMTNWCSDQPAYVHATVAYRYSAEAAVTAPCLNSDQRPSIELTGFEGPIAIPALP